MILDKLFNLNCDKNNLPLCVNVNGDYVVNYGFILMGDLAIIVIGIGMISTFSSYIYTTLFKKRKEKKQNG